MIDPRDSDARTSRQQRLFTHTLFACVSLTAVMLATAPASAAPAAKVEVCHIPPGNPDNFHTITISENALAAHLEHGDFVGACNELCATLCDDGDACTIDDPADWDCEEQGCPPIPRSEINCDDGNECNTDSCDSASGQCVYINDKVGQACNQDKFCPFLCDSAGICQPDETVDCCEDDSWCDATYCNGNYCDLVDHTCRSTGDPCIDTVECTVDMCFNDTGCQNEPMDELCDDEVYCTIDTCDSALGCRHDPDSSLCDDGIACTVNEVCDPVSGCGSTPDNSLCDDGIACTVNEVCNPETGCESTADDSLCDDGNRCTIDKCDPSAGGCRHDQPDPNCCNSDDECATGEQCNDDPSDPTCQPICVTAFDYQGTGDIAGFISDCQQGCPNPTICYESPPVTDCVYGGNPAACEQVNNIGLSYGCRICPAPPNPDVSCPCWDGSPGSAGSSLENVWTTYAPPNCQVVDRCLEQVDSSTGGERSEANCVSDAPGNPRLLTVAIFEPRAQPGAQYRCSVQNESGPLGQNIPRIDLTEDEYLACRNEHNAFTATTDFPSGSDPACGLPNP